MEASGVVYRPLPRVCGGAGVGGTNRVGNLRFPVVRKYAQSGYSDEGYLKYYYNNNRLPEGRIRCGGGGGPKMLEEVKGEEKKKMKLMKKRLKLLKSLSKDMDIVGLDLDNNNNRQGLLDQIKGNMISDATEVLLTQLGQQLRAEEKELKRKKKEAKALKKAEQKKNKKMMMLQCDMASSSESSSDSECGEVVDMSRRLKTQVLAPPPPPPVGNELQPEQLLKPTAAAAASITTTTAGHGGGLAEELQHSRVNVAIVDQPLLSSSEVVENRKKIEVCMGGKCKKSGAALLIEEFNKVLGSSSSSVAAAVGCKCMGKCRSAPNVRVLNEEAQNTPVAAKSLCIGVGLDDVTTIVSNFLLQTPPVDDGFSAASASASWSGAM